MMKVEYSNDCHSEVDFITRNGKKLSGGVWLTQGLPESQREYYVHYDDIDALIKVLQEQKDIIKSTAKLAY